jgi:NHS family xanthosine MFS transporter
VWGTVGFVCAMWVIDFGKWTVSPIQLYVSSSAGFLLGVYAFTLPACAPARTEKKKNIISILGLDAFVLFKNSRMAVFFLFAMFLGAALQITNTFGEAFIHDFSSAYPDSFAVQHPSILMSASQISETLFILTIPFFLNRFGIRSVMLISIFAWMLRFAFFAFGNPGDGFMLLVLSMIIYGMAFDFFNISGSLFVKSEADNSIIASAQGLFMLMTNGVGAFLGGMISGWVVDYFTSDKGRDWQSIWLSFAGYALVLGVVFPIVFRYKHIQHVRKN